MGCFEGRSWEPQLLLLEATQMWRLFIIAAQHSIANEASLIKDDSKPFSGQTEPLGFAQVTFFLLAIA